MGTMNSNTQNQSPTTAMGVVYGVPTIKIGARAKDPVVMCDGVSERARQYLFR